ncbi:thiamine pyrophosphokinase [Coemansia sp. RSA 2607]|nr:thiamine pyrophosphokinase [Coemansia sp. RSA 2607]
MVFDHPGSYALYNDGDGDISGHDAPLAVLVLNQPIPHAHTLLPAIWQRATHRLCIDGGTNHLHALSTSHPHTFAALVPTAIVGDLDSLIPEARDHYSALGTTVHQYADQDTTDFMKGLRYLDEHLEGHQCTVVVFGGLGGRLDHILHTLKVLLNEHTRNARRILVISEDNLTFVLPQGETRIHLRLDRDGPTCGILPLAGPVRLTTQGLRWNLHDQESEVTGLMSTSNLVDSEKVLVQASGPVVWTCELRP